MIIFEEFRKYTNSFDNRDVDPPKEKTLKLARATLRIAGVALIVLATLACFYLTFSWFSMNNVPEYELYVDAIFRSVPYDNNLAALGFLHLAGNALFALTIFYPLAIHSWVWICDKNGW